MGQDLKMQLSEKDGELLAEVAGIFAKAESVFSGMSAVGVDKCLDFHTESCSVNHAVRWGSKACDELLEAGGLKVTEIQAENESVNSVGRDDLIIKEVSKLLDKAEFIFSQMSSQGQDICLNFHNEEYSLNHAVRWGAQAGKDLTQDKNLFLSNDVEPDLSEVGAPTAAVEDKYVVNPEKDSVVITRLKDGATLFMQGDDASQFLNEVDSIEDVGLRNYAISQYDDVFDLPEPQIAVDDSSLDEARNKSQAEAFELGMQKGSCSVVDTTLDKTHSGKVLGVTDHHIVLSLGRSALVVGKADIDRVPAVGEEVDLKFAGGKGVFAPVKAVGVER